MLSYRFRCWFRLPVVSIALVALACGADELNDTPSPPAGPTTTTGEPPPSECGACQDNEVCCPSPLLCAGRCVPDCRVSTNPVCPTVVPTCNQNTGLCEAPVVPLPEVVSTLSFTSLNPTSGNLWWAKAFFPSDASSAKRYPTIVAVPGGTGAGSTSENIGDPLMNPGSQAAQGFVVVVFDADGRGNTPGFEDQCGFVHQDGLKALIETVADLDIVDPSRIGLSTSSYGITMGSGVLARYPEIPVRFLVDGEGPADRNDTGHCDGSDTGHMSGRCTDETWWIEREAATFIREITIPYLRVQNVVDHVQPDNDHAILMINNATSTAYGGAGRAPWTRVNLATQNQPNQVYSEGSPPTYNPNEAPLDTTGLWAELFALEL